MSQYVKVTTEEAAGNDSSKPPPLKDDSHDEEERMSSQMLCCAVTAILVMLLLGIIDSFTTKYLQTWCERLADWTLVNAPGSFVIFELVIFCFIVLCLPYGLLAVLSGALFYQKYGGNGILLAGFALFFTSLAAGCLCFSLSRYRFRNLVKKKIDKSPNVRESSLPSHIFYEGSAL
jgi:uncharacterized membrane protein YdjX (TVP38/TMEM64 family)